MKAVVTLAVFLRAVPVSAGELAGRVLDAASGRPIVGATVTADDRGTRTDEQGLFRLPGGETLRVRAPGYLRRDVAAGELSVAITLVPFSPKAIYLYPSSFQFGIPGYRNPVAHPYEIVSLTLARARQRTGLPPVQFRPWLQAFHDYAYDRRPFRALEIRVQIDAAERFGTSWMLWNPHTVYSKDGLKEDIASRRRHEPVAAR